jgi:hypothetical protein
MSISTPRKKVINMTTIEINRLAAQAVHFGEQAEDGIREMLDNVMESFSARQAVGDISPEAAYALEGALAEGIINYLQAYYRLD